MVFVDRDGKHFRHVLNWLRDGAIPVLSESDYQQLLREAEYYQLLVNKITLNCLSFSYSSDLIQLLFIMRWFLL